MSYGYVPADKEAYDLSVRIKKWAHTYLGYDGPIWKYHVRRYLSMGKPQYDMQLVDRIFREVRRFDKHKEERLKKIAEKNKREEEDRKRQPRLL